MSQGIRFFCIHPHISRNYITFVIDMDTEQLKISKAQIAAFLVIGAGLYFLTKSFFIALGVMVALIVIVNTAAHYITNRKKREEERHD